MMAEQTKEEASDLEELLKLDRTLEFVPICLLKRLSDIFVSGFMIVIASPVFLLLYITNVIMGLVDSNDRGNLFSRETRMTEGREFEILKFRVLKQSIITQIIKENRYHIKPLEKDVNNLTRLGRILIATYIDELPQLINVFTGDMSLVGPRPWPLPDYRVDKEQGYRRKDLIRPGLTGPVQSMKGHVGNLYSHDKRLDYEYIVFHATHGQTARLIYDLKYIIKTLKVLIQAKGY